MTKVRLVSAAMALSAATASLPLHGDVAALSETGFQIQLSAETPASKAQVWQALIAPAQWWSSQHTYSGDAANLYIDAQASGCFCEKLPKPADAPATQRMGSIEHMHVVYADPQRGVLRMVGGLGPLQGEAVHGVLTITLKPGEGGTAITWDYAVGGYFGTKPETLAPMVDKVLGEQLRHLAERATALSAAPAG